MSKYTVALEKCWSCRTWACRVDCPRCSQVFQAQSVAVAWVEELEAGDDDESSLEGMNLECPYCGWAGAVDEFRRERNGVRYFDLDDER